MRVGDLLEWIAAAAFVAGAYFATRLAWPSLLVGGAWLVYFAQCYSQQRLPNPLPKLLKLRTRMAQQPRRTYYTIEEFFRLPIKRKGG